LVARIIKNLAAVLPLAVILGFWLALADSFHVFATSPILLESLKATSLILVYGCLTTLIMMLGFAAVVSAIATLADTRAGLEPARHAGLVIGAVVFLLPFAVVYFGLGLKQGHLNLLDPRLLFPLLGAAIISWLLGKLAASYVERVYDPSNWLELLWRHYSAVAGLGIFVFGTSMTQFNSMKEEAYRTRLAFLNIENILYYLIFVVAGLVSWWVLRLLFRRLAKAGPAFVFGLISIFIAIPLIVWLRPSPPNNPDKHNPNPGSRGRNVVLISVDTLRYDRLGCNGNEHIQTPNIDALAEESVVFGNCISPIPLTIPSHASMLTGLNPRSHNLRVQDYYLDPLITTLPERLSEEGFTCGGFVSMAMMRGKNTKFDQGFHYYDDYWVFPDKKRYFPPETRYFFAGKAVAKVFTGRASVPTSYERTAEVTVSSALRWLDCVKDDDFFCFFHIFDPHWDYDAPEPYKTMYDPDYDESRLGYSRQMKQSIWDNKLQLDQDDIDHIIARYDGEVTYSDAQVGLLLNRLKELGLWDETLIILTSDHGESLEHDYFFSHADRTYQSCIHVPLIIKPFYGSNGKRWDNLCTNADYFPTICEALGIRIPDGLDGKSLAGLLGEYEGDDYVPHPVIFSESYAFDNYNIQHYGRTYAVIRDGWKIIYSPYAFPYVPIHQYFDLSSDPDEMNNLYESSRDEADSLFSVLLKWVEEDKLPVHGLWGRIERENLKTLQYLN
jgi:arylsulfatase A-like enzyme